MQTFEAFGFAEPLTRALTQCGYVTPTPIQVQALPPQLEGRDLLGLAETGSGKTATFLLPILQQIAAKPAEIGWKKVSALILAPTRELAIQIDHEVASLSRNMNIRRAVVLGGVSKGPQINALKRGVHVLVATPGRLLDLVNMRSCDLSGVQTLVIDEADRMFDMGFIRDIKKIVSLIPMKRRTALFSATMPAEIKKFAYDMLNDPFRVDLSTKTMVVERIDQKVMIVRTPEKQSRLHTILADPACERVIVFTRTKRGADRVAERLAMASVSSSAFHGNKAQNARQRALNDFMSGRIRVLVATDIAARGIDVSNITHVVNFDMPLDPETYVHRVGRTARKGTNGIAISLCDPSERKEILAIERLMKQKIEVIGDVGGEPLPAPERRAQNAPRRDGGYRNGRGGAQGHRGSGRPRQDATNDRSYDNRQSANGSGDTRNGRADRPQRSYGRPEGQAVFGVAERQNGTRQDNPAGSERRGPDQRGQNERTAQRRPGERGERHAGDYRADTHRNGRGQDTRQNRGGEIRVGRDGGNAPMKRNKDRGGEGRPSWAGNTAPKFMRQHEDDHAGSDRNPTS
jgi:ATP-dependent RNA helicase RhlE